MHDSRYGVGMVEGSSEGSESDEGSPQPDKGSVGAGTTGRGPFGLSGMGFHTLDDFDVRGRRVLLRVDINSPVDEKTLRLEDGSKIKSSVPNLRELMDRGAKVAILAHQGRPGDYDFIPLNEHASYLSQFTGKKVRYVDDIFGPHALRAIDRLGEGEAILLKNVRYFSEEQASKSPEEHAQSQLVKALAPKFDLHVNDAFGSSHRSHASLVGFTAVLPSAAGRLLEKEIKTLSAVFQNPRRPSTYIFGGTKFSDAIQAIVKLTDSDKVDHLLVAGLAGYAYLWALGRNIGSKTETRVKKDATGEAVSYAKKLFESKGHKIVLPVDAAIEVDGKRVDVSVEDIPADAAVLDIGPMTVRKFQEIILDSRMVFLSGPPGMFERDEFCVGTRGVFEAMVNSGAYCVIGGGHSSAAANRLGLTDKISYVSTGGGALERFMLGRPMPVVEALRESAKRI
jgi:phosphoglycerate kinase